MQESDVELETENERRGGWSWSDGKSIVKGRDSTEWSEEIPASSKTKSHNIVANKEPVLKGAALTATTMLDYFKTMFTAGILSDIVKYTNQKAEHTHQQVIQEPEANVNRWKGLTDVELQAYMEVLLLAGVEKHKRQPIKEMWTTEPAFRKHPFPAAMSRTRFKHISRFLRFDDLTTRKQRREDKLAPIRDLFDSFVRNLQNLVQAGENITIDEMLASFRGKCPFRVYMKSKPGRYGIKIWAAVDTFSKFVLQLQVYLGKINNTKETEQGKRVVLDMVRPYFNSGRGITADNFFSGLKLVQELLKQNLTYVGTLRKNRVEVPSQLLSIKGVPEFSSKFLFHGDVTLVNYVPKKNKCVLLLSTQHHDKELSSLGHKKPSIVMHYNATKAGVDCFDQMIMMM